MHWGLRPSLDNWSSLPRNKTKTAGHEKTRRNGISDESGKEMVTVRKWSPSKLQKPFMSPWMVWMMALHTHTHRPWLHKKKCMWATPKYAGSGLWSQTMFKLVYCASSMKSLLNLEIIPLRSHIFLFLLWDPCAVLSCLCPESKLGKINTSFRKGKFKLLSCLWISFPLQPVCLGEDLRRKVSRNQALRFCISLEFGLVSFEVKARAIRTVNILAYHWGILTVPASQYLHCKRCGFNMPDLPVTVKGLKRTEHNDMEVLFTVTIPFSWIHCRFLIVKTCLTVTQIEWTKDLNHTCKY